MFLLVLAYPGSPGQKAVKQLCVCVCVRACVLLLSLIVQEMLKIRQNIAMYFSDQYFYM